MPLKAITTFASILLALSLAQAETSSDPLDLLKRVEEARSKAAAIHLKLSNAQAELHKPDPNDNLRLKLKAVEEDAKALTQSVERLKVNLELQDLSELLLSKVKREIQNLQAKLRQAERQRADALDAIRGEIAELEKEQVRLLKEAADAETKARARQELDDADNQNQQYQEMLQNSKLRKEKQSPAAKPEDKKNTRKKGV